MSGLVTLVGGQRPRECECDVCGEVLFGVVPDQGLSLFHAFSKYLLHSLSIYYLHGHTNYLSSTSQNLSIYLHSFSMEERGGEGL